MGFESNPINLLKSKMDIFEGYVSFELTRFCSVAHQYIKYRRNWSRFIKNFTFYGITSLKEKSKYSQFRYFLQDLDSNSTNLSLLLNSIISVSVCMSLLLVCPRLGRDK